MTDAPEVTPLTVPDRPDPDDLIASDWGRWVHDHNATPKRFLLWRNANQTGLADGVNVVAFDGKDDPYGLCDTATSFRAPVAGVVLVTASISLGVTGTAANWYSYTRVIDAANTASELRRGAGPAGLSSQVSGGSSTVTTILPVAAGDRLGIVAVISAAGLTKTITGGKALTYFEGIYLSNPY